MKKGKKRNDVLEEAAAMPLSDEDLETVSSGRWLEASYAFGKKSGPDDSDEKK